jgi:hypothetical protein
MAMDHHDPFYASVNANDTSMNPTVASAIAQGVYMEPTLYSVLRTGNYVSFEFLRRDFTLEILLILIRNYFLQGIYRYICSGSIFQNNCSDAIEVFQRRLECIRYIHSHAKSRGIGVGRCQGSIRTQIIQIGKLNTFYRGFIFNFL